MCGHSLTATRSPPLSCPSSVLDQLDDVRWIDLCGVGMGVEDLIVLSQLMQTNNTATAVDLSFNKLTQSSSLGVGKEASAACLSSLAWNECLCLGFVLLLSARGQEVKPSPCIFVEGGGGRVRTHVYVSLPRHPPLLQPRAGEQARIISCWVLIDLLWVTGPARYSGVCRGSAQEHAPGDD